MVRRTFPAIRAQRPRHLYIIADGPRSSRADDFERCREARALVETMLDWECEVVRDYSEVNLGSGRRIASGLTTAFARYGEAIVIEDDILPESDFFTFCTKALARYRDDREVHGISGYNPIGRYLPGERCAVLAETHITWGWASWHRAWSSYRGQLEGWNDPAVQDRTRAHLRNDLYFDELARAFRAVEKAEVDAWDYQWIYTMLYEGRHAVVSAVNLIVNLGFVADATHTFHVPVFAKDLKVYRFPSSPWPEPGAKPDRLFDRLHWQVYLDGARWKIAVLRLCARFSRFLTARALKHHG